MPENEAFKKVAAMLSGLRTHSRLALKQATEAHETPGVAATLVIQISADPNKPAELIYSTITGSPSLVFGRTL